MFYHPANPKNAVLEREAMFLRVGPDEFYARIWLNLDIADVGNTDPRSGGGVGFQVVADRQAIGS